MAPFAVAEQLLPVSELWVATTEVALPAVPAEVHDTAVATPVSSIDFLLLVSVADPTNFWRFCFFQTGLSNLEPFPFVVKKATQCDLVSGLTYIVT